MFKLVFILFLVGVGILALGVKFQDKRNRTLGLGLMAAALLLFFLSRLGNISIFPTLNPSPTPGASRLISP